MLAKQQHYGNFYVILGTNKMKQRSCSYVSKVFITAEKLALLSSTYMSTVY